LQISATDPEAEIVDRPVGADGAGIGQFRAPARRSLGWCALAPEMAENFVPGGG